MAGRAGRGLVGVFAAVAAVAAGCSSTVDGQATEEGSAPTSVDTSLPLFNPCTDLSDEVLSGDNLDPSTKRVSVDSRDEGVEAWWKICNWDSTEGPYGVSVFSTRRTVPERRTNPESLFVRDVMVGDRAGIVTTKQESNPLYDLTCYVSFPAAHGMFEIGVSWMHSERDKLVESPPCGIAVEHAIYFEKNLPG